MKKLYTILGLFIAFSVFGQKLFSESTEGLRYRDVNSNNNRDAEIEGTPYVYPEYVAGTVEGFKETYKMRYNAFLDEVIFKKDALELALLKEKLYSTIKFKETNETLKLENYTYKKNDILGYLFVVAQNNTIVIYKKRSVIYTPFVAAANSFYTDSPASYKAAPDVYFIKSGSSNIVEMPTNKNKLIAIFPEKKEIINNYFKANKVNLSDSGDLKKLVQIL